MLRRALIVAVLAGCHSSPPPKPVAAPAEVAAAKPEAPAAGTPEVAASAPDAAARFQEWLTAFNSADAAAIAEMRKGTFVPEHPHPPAEAAAAFSEDTGGFEVVEVEAQTPASFTALMKERASEQYARAVLEVEAAPPHRIRSFTVKGIATPPKYAPARLDEAGAIAFVAAELERRAAAGEFSGAVAIARDGKEVFARAYGLADRDAGRASTLDTRFRLGSMNKMFTAVTALQLVQAGKLKLDDTVGTHLPDYPNEGVRTKVTIHHLLSHTGGTGDFFGPEFDQHRRDLRTHADYVKLFGARDLQFEPGSKWAYSNYGFLLLGAIIEKVTRKPYYDAVQAAVYKRAGMKATSSPSEDTPMRGRSVGYTRESKQAAWKPNTDTLPYRGTAAGGGDSTVGDLLRFARALTGHKLLDAKHTALLTSAKPETPVEIPYGYGFSFAEHSGIRCIGHGGGAPGMNGELLICDNGYTIAVLANLDPPAASRIAELALSRLPAK